MFSVPDGCRLTVLYRLVKEGSAVTRELRERAAMFRWNATWALTSAVAMVSSPAGYEGVLSLLYLREDSSAPSWPSAMDCTSRRKSVASMPLYFLRRGSQGP